jgi:hypothetical protein
MRISPNLEVPQSRSQRGRSGLFWLFSGAVTLGLTGAAIWQFWLKGQVEFGQVASSFVAKQICSCLHVAGRSLDSCLQDFTADISVLTVYATDAGPDAPASVTAETMGGLIKAVATSEPSTGACTLQ